MSYHYVKITIASELADRASAVLMSAGASGIETRDESTMIAASQGTVEVIGWFPTETVTENAALGARAAFGPSVEVLANVVEDPGWREAWREYFRPMRFGRRLWVTPPDEEPPSKGSRDDDIVVVRLVPSGAFGTGTHESTALMLELLDELVRSGTTVLDVGCGSGILTMAAALLGARSAKGIDIDTEAVECAAENCTANALDERCQFDDTPIAQIEGRFDLVLANLSAPVLIREREALASLVDFDGLLLWSGLLETDLDEVGTPSGLVLTKDLRRNGWVAQAWKR